MTEGERTALAHLEVRLFGLDGEGGAIGAIRDDVQGIRTKVDRWDGAVTFVKVAAGVLGLGGLTLIFRALVP